MTKNLRKLRRTVLERVRGENVLVVGGFLGAVSAVYDALHKVVGEGLYGLCYTTLKGRPVWVNSGLSEYDTVLTCLHEVTHASIAESDLDLALEEEEELCDSVAEYVYNHRRFRLRDRKYILSLF
jgi:hypothetical protein